MKEYKFVREYKVGYFTPDVPSLAQEIKDEFPGKKFLVRGNAEVLSIVVKEEEHYFTNSQLILLGTIVASNKLRNE